MVNLTFQSSRLSQKSKTAGSFPQHSFTKTATPFSHNPAGPSHGSPAWPPARQRKDPVVAEQHEIVRRVGLLFERADTIEREVVAAGRRCEWLTQAVMVKAFSGML